MKNYYVKKKQMLILMLSLFSGILLAQKKTYTVGMLLDERTEKIDTLLVRLQKQVQAVVGEDATIVFSEEHIFESQYHLEKARTAYDNLADGKVDIIMAFGAVNNKVIVEQDKHEKPTILFGSFNQDMVPEAFSEDTKAFENFIFLVEPQSYRSDLAALKVLSEFKKVGVVIEKQLLELLPLKATFDAITTDLGITYGFIPFENPSDIISGLKGFDAIYFAGGFTLSDTDVKTIANKLVEKKLPSFTLNGIDQVHLGLMATNQPNTNVNQGINKLALTIEQFVNDTPIEELTGTIEYEPRLTLNYNTAEAIGVAVRYSFLNDTDLVGKIDNALAIEKYKLSEAIQKGLAQNLNLKAAKIQVNQNYQNVKSAKADYLPTIMAQGIASYTDPDNADISFGQNPEFQTSAGVAFEQTLFSETMNANIKIQKQLQLAEQENLKAEALNTVFNVSNSYFQVLILKASTEIQLRNQEVTRRIFQLAEQNFESGLTGKSDVFRLRSQLVQNTQAVVEAVNALEQGYNGLNQILNNDLSTEIDVIDISLDDTVFNEFDYSELFALLDDPATLDAMMAFLSQEAIKNAPELKALDFNLAATERNIKLNGIGRLLPTLSLEGRYTEIFSRTGAGSNPTAFELPNNLYTAGVTMSLPIFNGNRTNIARQNAQIAKSSLSIQKASSELTIATNVRNSVLNLINQFTNIELSKESEKMAQEALKLTKASYGKGAITIIQVIDAQNNLLNTQLAKATAIYSYLLSAIQVERAIGHYFLLSTEEENSAFTKRFFEYLNTKNEQ
ncbi:TolC family protein [uncultured Croceitalea sp.]|uniref:TolC family protein n=1 Tax=uncultured Croceitalea sp. TaxID=1798908 RepID=UPI003305DE50